MKFCFLLFLCLGMLFNSSAQRIITSDGIDMGPAANFLKNCESNLCEGLLNQGLKIDTKSFCQCMVDDLLTSITKKECNFFFYEGHLEELFTNEKTAPIMLDCIKSNLSVDRNTIIKGQKIMDTTSYELTLKSCKMNLSQPDYYLNKVQAEDYCECAYKRIAETDFTYEDLMTDSGKRSSEAAVLKANCMSYALYNDSTIFNNNINIVQGKPARVEQYLDIDNKIRIQIGTKTHLFSVDTTNQESYISDEIEAELLILGILNSSNLFGEIELENSLGEMNSCKIYVLPSAKVGPYIVHEIPLIIAPDDQLLIGSAFFQGFKFWKIDSEKGTIILEK